MKLLFLLFTFSALLLPARSAPNIVIILADDLGWPDGGTVWSQHLSSVDPLIPAATDLKTPNLDILARDGVRFTNGYVTAPICSPSRAGLMSGRYQQRFGYEINPGPSLEYDPIFGLPRTESTIGDRMKALGYGTAWIGKSHLGARPEYHPVTRGFDEFFGFLEGHHNYCSLGQCEFDENEEDEIPPWIEDPIQRATAPLSAQNPAKPVSIPPNNYLTTVFQREMVSYIHRHFDQHPGQPFCLYAPFNAVHEPMEITQDFLDRTKPLYPGPDVTPANAPIRHRMAAMLLALDDAVGAIRAELLLQGQWENTMIIFTSDNGAPPSTRIDANGSVSLPLRGNKSELYEGGIRVPFIVHWPARYSSRTVHAPVSTLDILPTCVEAAGGHVPAAWQLDGVSLLPYLDGLAPQPHPVMYWRMETGRADEMEPGPRAMRKDQWKLIKNAWGRNWELYDLSTPDGLRETANAADAHPEVLQELIPLFNAWEATLPRPRWDFDDPDYVTPTFVLEDVRVGKTDKHYLAPEFLPNSNKMAWQDETGRLLRGTIDLTTGFPAGTPVEVTTGIAAPSPTNEGPQWGVSAGGASLFYTKTGATQPRLQIWRDATQLTTHLILDNFGARVSQDASSPVVGMIFNRGTSTASTIMAATDAAPGTVVSLPNQVAVPRNGRWIPATQDIVYIRTGTPPQLARYNTVAGSNVTLTDDGIVGDDRAEAWAFYAPEYGYELCYACLVNRTGIAIYRDLKRGGGLFDRVATLTVPATETARYLFQMKPLQGARGFNGVSWFSCAAWQNTDALNPGASAIWLLGAGTDPAHRLPMPPPATGRNDLCKEWKPLALRVSDPLAAGLASEPETVIGAHEVFCYYTRKIGSDPVQLRLARTGLVKPEADATGFAALNFTRDFTPGPDNDVTNQRPGGTETTALVPHAGKLYAATSSRGDSTAANPTTFTGVQILVKETAGALWKLEHTGDPTSMFKDHIAADVLTELTITRSGASLLPAPVQHLAAGLRDLPSNIPGSHIASARLRVGPGVWSHSTVVITPAAADPAHVMSFAVHRDADTGNEFVFAGLSNGEIYRAIYYPDVDEHLAWVPTPDLPQNPAAKFGPVTSLTEANGLLYAACGMRQDTPADAVAGGLFVRKDVDNSWQRVYTWPTPLPAHAAPERQRVMTSLTAVPDPRGCAHEVLLAARSWPGVVELIDPGRVDLVNIGPEHPVSVELDVRDFFARLWNDNTVRNQDVSVGYTPFTPAIDPVTGQRVHVLGVWIERPGAPNTATYYLVRHFDGTWEPAGIPGSGLRATRCFAASPFAADAGSVFYFGGYDATAGTAHDTAWIMRGVWGEWPELSIALDGQDAQLNWPFTGPEWLLEKSTALGPWETLTDKPARSLTGTSLSVPVTAPRQFFRLSRP